MQRGVRGRRGICIGRSVQLLAFGMRALLLLLALALVCAPCAPCAATAPALLECIATQAYLRAGTPENTIYAAMQNAGAGCAALAARVACLRHFGAARGMSDGEFWCTIDCSGAVSAQCPGLVFFAGTCPQVAPSACEAQLRALLMAAAQ